MAAQFFSRSLMSRQQLVDWAYSLLPDPFSCPREVGATYRLPIRELEWASRPLNAVFALIAGGEDPDDPRLAPFIERMRRGFTPDDALAFPDPAQPGRQVVLEQAVYGYGLLCLGDRLLGMFTQEQRDRMVAWLNMANDIELPWGSWYTARILVNCGLKHCDLPYNEERLAADCTAVESMYDGDGWYEDGTPFKRDLYIASTFHFVSLLLEHYMDKSPIACAVDRANAFNEDYIYWFDRQGRGVPFGRSLTYRFVNAAFWSSFVLAGGSKRPLAQLKGLILNHLSWWYDAMAGQPGCMRPGYGYPGAPVMEDYAGPGISYWGFRAFALLALPESDPFWQVEPELPVLDARRMEEKPGMIIQTGERHSYALSAMQYPGSTLLQCASKYGKLCYSTAFGWNISCGTGSISEFALDSALALSVRGTGQFASRTRIQDYRVNKHYIYSVWGYGSVAHVETWLVPIDEFRHVRVHRVQSLYPLEAYEGGFPVFGWSSKYDIAEKGAGEITIRRANGSEPELSSGMVSGISDVFAARETVERTLCSAGLKELVAELDGRWTSREAVVVRQNPNSNIYDCEMNAVPALKASVSGDAFCFGCVVYGDPGTNAAAPVGHGDKDPHNR